MSDEILINITPPETRVAVLENGVLQELIIERQRKRDVVGNLYRGEICRVMPGIQAAFVEIGIGRAGFLHASDVLVAGETPSEDKGIEHFLQQGQKVVVQVLKAPIGTKGPRLTMSISIPSRYQVFLPYSEKLALSQQLEDEAERERLLACMEIFKEQGYSGGYIARTASEGVSEESIRADMLFLNKLWEVISLQVKEVPIGLIYEDLPLALRILRDWYQTSVTKIVIDSKSNFDRMLDFSIKFMPEVEHLLELYKGHRPLFDMYSIESDIKAALERKVPLKSGGHLILDQTEAMTTVDVNTGSYLGRGNQEQTIFKTNMEAAQVTAHQLRLRNLGGIIIIDFIDMHNEEHKAAVLNALEKAMIKDHAKYTISNVSELGLVEMTRKRTRESLEQVLCEPCATCSGTGMVRTPETTCYEIFREIIRDARQYEAKELLVLASNEVVDMMLDEESTTLADLESFVGIRIRFRAENEYTQEQYDVVLV
ncbi:MAG: ribonuclease G [Cycloclasticus pugetii]|jgi:ribonuclease G|uniref:Ribonuclease G n=2 Tax=Cycloclasticus TaxID=34067 RepID=S5TE71_9GAMM|nr:MULTISPECIES: ribonuclease G [Cycloclasticus]AFT67688.1 Ribonuclease G [Cycloclasticus sp. P1]AGS39142.1 Ribonuclease G [Cycloclasticus zancles 78-ME]ATI02768.1 ribonuclease G [Cycloclasticus sp. PY97N]EPD13512.1 ribonuclease G [Cycloclasticus pugetii]MBV1897743.1 ribonuclease G [Cycloclasticus sp.]|tara:strand:- start:3293 stop:4744 length:1452 start_codon:yes stop_codon:yes gene_type:complete